MTVDERSVTTALKAYARGIDVTDADVDRLEARVGERLHGAPISSEGGVPGSGPWLPVPSSRPCSR